MSTRANILIINSDNTITQYYHHCDGYPSGVGEELRRCSLIGIGINSLTKENVDVATKTILNTDSDYEEEYSMGFEEHNHLHGDLSYLYVLDLAKYTCDDIVSLYYRGAFRINEEFDKNIDVIKATCIARNKVDMTKQLLDD